MRLLATRIWSSVLRGLIDFAAISDGTEMLIKVLRLPEVVSTVTQDGGNSAQRIVEMDGHAWFAFALCVYITGLYLRR